VVYDSTELQYPRIVDSGYYMCHLLTYSLVLWPSESLGFLNYRHFVHCHHLLTLIISVFYLHSLWFSYDVQNKLQLFFKWQRSVGLCNGKGICFLWSKKVMFLNIWISGDFREWNLFRCQYSNQQTHLIKFNSWHTCFGTGVPFSGSVLEQRNISPARWLTYWL
jgi:hypothetical protein